MSTTKLREDAMTIFRAGLAAVDPKTAVRRALSRDGEMLSCAGESYNLADFEDVVVIGAGKAGAPMAAAVEEILDEWNSIDTSRGRLVLLTPTQSVKDRLAWYYHSRDRPSLLQAVAVATHCEIDFDDLRRWSEGEQSLHMYEDFLAELAR